MAGEIIHHIEGQGAELAVGQVEDRTIHRGVSLAVEDLPLLCAKIESGWFDDWRQTKIAFGRKLHPRDTYTRVTDSMAASINTFLAEVGARLTEGKPWVNNRAPYLISSGTSVSENSTFVRDRCYAIIPIDKSLCWVGSLEGNLATYWCTHQGVESVSVRMVLARQISDFNPSIDMKQVLEKISGLADVDQIDACAVAQHFAAFNRKGGNYLAKLRTYEGRPFPLFITEDDILVSLDADIEPSMLDNLRIDKSRIFVFPHRLVFSFLIEPMHPDGVRQHVTIDSSKIATMHKIAALLKERFETPAPPPDPRPIPSLGIHC